MNGTKDYLLGQIALERGLITEKQLMECTQGAQVFPEDPEKTIGRAERETRPLGVVLLSKGYIQEKDLIALIEEQTLRVKSMEDYRQQQKFDVLFGELLVKARKATQNQVNKCLEIQEQLAQKGARTIPRLGEMLVEHGFIDKKTVQDMLRQQNKDILCCTGCGLQYNVVGVQEGKTYKCKKCNGIMLTRSLLDSLKAEETHYGFELGEGGRPTGP